MNTLVRVRYAPSPTGLPHVGNIRTALFNWLFARHCGGSFIVRIEDTDRERYVEGAVAAILDSLLWLGLDWDEGPDKGGDYGPYYQSERLEMYRMAAWQLVQRGQAYYCHCSPERLERMRAEQAARKEPPGYDRCCRDQGLGAAPGAVIRFKIPLSEKTTFDDIIRGQVTFDNDVLDDFVLLKSDGYPTYHLANVIDDHAMAISHVLRAEEWLSSTPRHLMLYRALGFTPPQFAHLPIILGTDRSKLSKRHGAVAITDFRAEGYLPETMVNFLALLGWAYDDKTELFSRDELVRLYSLERVSKTAAIFNREKLDWMNGVYIRSLADDDLAARLLPFLEKGLPECVKRPLSLDYIKLVVPLIKERLKRLDEAPGLCAFLFENKITYDASLLIDKKMGREATIAALQRVLEKLKQLDCFDAAAMEAAIRPLAEALGIKAGQLFGILRTATTGQLVAPPLFQTMAVLGRERTLERIEAAIADLETMPGS